MSLARTALRLATLEALRPSAALASNGPWLTLAGKSLFDSRVDPIDDLSPHESRPIACIYTDDDEGMPGQKAGGPPFRMIVDLVFELSVVALAPSDADPDVYEAGIPETDAELEGSLDLLEAQIKFILLFHPNGFIWRRLTGRKVKSIHSVAHRSSEEAVRLARRRVVWKVEVLDDCFDAAPAANVTGLDRLPQPLRGVVETLAATAYGAKIAQGLALDTPTMPVAPPLKTVTLNEAVANPAGVMPAQPNIVGAVNDLDA